MTDARATGPTEPARQALRNFGLSVGAAFIVIFGLFLPWVFSFHTPIWPFVVGVLLIVPGLLFPGVLAPVYHGWMWIALKIGAFNSRIILGIVFFTVITPVGIVRRLLGADALGLRVRNVESYRKPSRQRSIQSMERPF